MSESNPAPARARWTLGGFFCPWNRFSPRLAVSGTLRRSKRSGEPDFDSGEGRDGLFGWRSNGVRCSPTPSVPKLADLLVMVFATV